MNTDRGQSPEPRDVDAEFARMLEGEGLQLRPGQAPREPAAPDPPQTRDGGDTAGSADDPLWSFSADSPPEPPSPESVARSRAAHPSAPGPGRTAGPRDADVPREFDDDEIIYGDFEEPDPDLPTPSSTALWSWTALLGGFTLMLIVAVSPALPSVLGWFGGLATIGGVISLLLRAPREHPEDRGDHGNGAEL